MLLPVGSLSSSTLISLTCLALFSHAGEYSPHTTENCMHTLDPAKMRPTHQNTSGEVGNKSASPHCHISSDPSACASPSLLSLITLTGQGKNVDGLIGVLPFPDSMLSMFTQRKG